MGYTYIDEDGFEIEISDAETKYHMLDLRSGDILRFLPGDSSAKIKILKKNRDGYIYQCLDTPDKEMGCVHNSNGSSHPFFAYYWEKVT